MFLNVDVLKLVLQKKNMVFLSGSATLVDRFSAIVRIMLWMNIFKVVQVQLVHLSYAIGYVCYGPYGHRESIHCHYYCSFSVDNNHSFCDKPDGENSHSIQKSFKAMVLHYKQASSRYAHHTAPSAKYALHLLSWKY